MDQSALQNRPSIMQSLLESIENEVCLGGPREPPSHDAISECVDNEGHVNKALPGRHIGKITDPQHVRRWRPELTVHLVTRTGR